MRWLNGITDSMDMNLSELKKIVKDRKPGVLQFMGLQRVEHNLATEQQQRFNLKLIFNLPTIKNFILIPCWASQVAEL